MNHLFDSKYIGQIPEAETSALRELVGKFCDSQAKEFVTALLGITAEQLEDLAVDAPISFNDAIALLNITDYLDALNLDDAALNWHLPVQLLHDRLDGVIKEFHDVAEQYSVKELRDKILSGAFLQAFQPVDESELFRSIVSVSGYDSVDEVLSNYHIFVDASSLSCEEMPIFLDRLLPRITSLDHPLKITVPYSVVSCLEEMVADPEQALLSGAKGGIVQLKRIQNHGLLSVRGDDGDSTIMSTFLSALSRFKPRYRMMLITQDLALASAVMFLNASGVEGSEILAVYLDDFGMPQLWWFEDEQENQSGTAEEATGQKELDGEKTETEAEDLLKEIDPRPIQDDIEEQEADNKNAHTPVADDEQDTHRPLGLIPVTDKDEEDDEIDEGGGRTSEADLDEMAILTQRIDTLLGSAVEGVKGDEDENESDEYVIPTGSEDLELLEEEHLDAVEAEGDSAGEAEETLELQASEMDGSHYDDGRWDVIE